SVRPTQQGGATHVEHNADQRRATPVRKSDIVVILAVVPPNECAGAIQPVKSMRDLDATSPRHDRRGDAGREWTSGPWCSLTLERQAASSAHYTTESLEKRPRSPIDAR